MEYAARVVPDLMASYLFLSIILVSSRPYLMAMAPILLFEMTNLTQAIFEVGRYCVLCFSLSLPAIIVICRLSFLQVEMQWLI
jgi:hypothetical protein